MTKDGTIAGRTDSYQQFGEKRFLTASLMKWMYELYTTDPEKRKEIYASPLQSTVEQLTGLPPALIQVAELVKSSTKDWV